MVPPYDRADAATVLLPLIFLNEGPLVLVPGVAICLAADAWATPGMLVFSGLLGIPYQVLGFSRYVLTDTAMGAGIVLLFIGLRPVAEVAAPLLDRIAGPVRWLAGCSFTLYVLHNPMLLLIRGHGIGAGDNVAVLLAMLAIIIGLSALIATLIEHKSPQFRAALTAQFAPRAAIA